MPVGMFGTTWINTIPRIVEKKSFTLQCLDTCEDFVHGINNSFCSLSCISTLSQITLSGGKLKEFVWVLLGILYHRTTKF